MLLVILLNKKNFCSASVIFIRLFILMENIGVGERISNFLPLLTLLILYDFTPAGCIECRVYDC